MIEISISRELADAHPGFMAHCAHRGHAISVFDSDSPAARSHETAGAETYMAGDHAAGSRWAIERRASRTERTENPETRRATSDLRRPARSAPSPTERRPLWPEASLTPGGVGRLNVPVNASTPEIAAPGPTDPPKEDYSMTENRSTASAARTSPWRRAAAGRQRPGQSDPDCPSARSPRSLLASDRACAVAGAGAGDGVVRWA